LPLRKNIKYVVDIDREGRVLGCLDINGEIGHQFGYSTLLFLGSDNEIVAFLPIETGT
jgi:hypothetical protein